MGKVRSSVVPSGKAGYGKEINRGGDYVTKYGKYLASDAWQLKRQDRLEKDKG